MKFIYLFIFLFFITILHSQSIIKGKVTQNDNQPIVSASIILKNDTGETTFFTFTNELGNFEINTNDTGKFTISVNSLGYEEKSAEIILEKKNDTKNINFKLNTKLLELEEVFIESKKPITIKNDTIVFNAKSFIQGNEQVVEDLLKKIPGLNVATDGTIKVGNQEIEKIMIDGDDMFEKGYKILTKNMPVNPIDKIELYQNYSNNKLLKGVENSNKVALNLTLKEDYKRQWFGNAILGYGLVSENRYDARSNIMNFGKKTKYYFITNINNVGEDATGDINHLIRPYRFDEPATIGDDQSAKTLIALNSSLPNLKQKRVNFNNAEMLSLNSIFTISEKIKIKTLGFFNTDENDLIRNSFQTFSNNNLSFTNTENFKGRKKQITGFGKIDLTYDISKRKMFEYVGKFNKTDENNSSNLLFNNNLLSEKLKSDNQLIDQKIVLTNKLKENKVLLFSGRYINESTPQKYSVNQFIFQDLFSENANNTIQNSQNKMEFLGFEAHMLNKKNNEDLFEIKVGNQLRVDKLNTSFELFNNNLSLNLPNGYQNNLKYTTNDIYVSLKYLFKFNNFKLLTQSDFHQVFSQLKSFENKKNQSPFFAVPKISLDWIINEKNKIITTYSYSTTNAGILDVYSNFVQTGFRSFSKGLEEFNQLNSSSAIINYSYGNWGDKFFANTFILYSNNNDFYSTNSIIAQNYSQTEKIIIKDRNFLSVSSNIDYYFNPIKSNFKINFGITKTNFKNILNNSELREVNNLGAEYGFEVRSGFKTFFNYHFGSKWNYNQVKTTIENNFTDNMSFLDLSFMLGNKFNLQIQSERYVFGNLDKQNNEYYFVDAEARYTAKKNKLTFYLTGNNLFNTETFRNYYLSDINTSKTEYKIQPRYVLLKMEFRF